MPTNPCCCNQCTIYHDGYSTDTLAGSWTVVSGSWSIAADLLSIEDANALLIANEPHPDGDYQPQVTRALVRFDTAGDIARLIVAYEDSDNYLFVEFWIGTDGCGHVQMYERIEGVSTAIGEEYALPFEIEEDTWSTVSLCYLPGESVEDAGTLTTRIVNDGHVWAGSAETSPDLPGDQGGLGTGATVAGTIDFDNFDYLYHYESEDHPDCPECSAAGGCYLHEDDFNRSNTTDVGCAWDEVEGDWSVNANELLIAEPDAILQNRTQLTDEEGEIDGHVYLRFILNAAAGAVVRVILDYADDSNFFFVELTPSSHGDSGSITFWRRTAGVDTEITHDSVLEGLTAGDDVFVAICWHPYGVVRVTITNGTTSSTHSTNNVDQEAAIPYVGLGTGAGGSAAVRFDDWLIRRLVPDEDLSDPDLGTCASCNMQGCTLDLESDYEGDLWEVAAGSWAPSADTQAITELFSPYTITTSSTGAILLNRIGHPQTTGEGHLDLTSAAYVGFFTFGYGNIIRVLIGVEDDENYLYGEVELSPDDESTGWVRVGKVEAGVDTMIAEEETSVAGGQPHLEISDPGSSEHTFQGANLLQVCYDGFELRAVFTNNAYPNSGVNPPLMAVGDAGAGWNPGKSGLATGTVSDPVHFGSWGFYHDIYSGDTICLPCVPSLACPICGENDEDGACLDRTPPIMLLRLTGMQSSAGPPDCPEIVELNDTFAMPLNSVSGNGGNTGSCVWLIYPHVCDAQESSLDTQIRVTISKSGSGFFTDFEAAVFAYDPDAISSPWGASSITWLKQFLIGGVSSGVVFNPHCLDEPADEDFWGLDCIEFLNDWLLLDDFSTSSGWIGASSSEAAEIKVLA